jgi:hypothetical protein
MSTPPWEVIYPDLDGEPVIGLEWPFVGTARQAEATAESVRMVEGAFRHLSRIDQTALQGKAAVALVSSISEIDGVLGDIAPVFDDVAGVLRRHGQQLRDLRQDATLALAQAQAGWRRRRTASEQERSASSRLSESSGHLAAVEHQVAQWRVQVEVTSPEDAGHIVARDHLGRLEAERDGQRRLVQQIGADVAAASKDRAAAENELAHWRNGPGNPRSWQALRDAEEALNQRTALAIHAVDLRDLRDKSFWERILGAIDSFTDGDYLAFILQINELHRELVGAVLEGIEATLKFLETLTTVVLYVAAIVTAVALAVGIGATFVGAAPVAVLALAIAGAGLLVTKKAAALKTGLSLARTVNDTARWAHGRASGDPDRVTETELLGSYVSRAASLATGKLADRIIPTTVTDDIVRGLTKKTYELAIDKGVERGYQETVKSGARLYEQFVEPLGPREPAFVPMTSDVDTYVEAQANEVRTVTPSDLTSVTPVLCGVRR